LHDFKGISGVDSHFVILVATPVLRYVQIYTDIYRYVQIYTDMYMYLSPSLNV